MKLTNRKVWMIAIALALGLTVSLTPAWAGDVERLMAQGKAYYNQGQLNNAEACYLQVIRLKPNYAQPHNELGCIYYKMGFFIDAIDEFHKAIRLDPGHVEAHSNLGYIHAQSGYFEGAMAEYQWLKARDPATAQKLYTVISAKKAEVSDTPREKITRGSGLLGVKPEGVERTPSEPYRPPPRTQPSRPQPADPDQTVSRSDSGQSQNVKKEAEDWNYKGVQYRAGRRDRDAFAAFTKAVQLDPNKAKYWENRARSAGWDLKNWEQALQDINRAIQLEPNNGNYWLTKSAILIELKRWDESKRARAQARRLGL